MVLRKGDSGEKVKELQKLLGSEITGKFDIQTDQSVKKFQSDYFLTVDGIVGPQTASVLSLGLKFNRTYMLTGPNENKGCTGNYFAQNTTKKTLVYHHTAGWTVNKDGSDNKNFFYGWENNIGSRIATHFSIGVSGMIYLHFPLQYWAHHLGIRNPQNTRMNQESISVELGNEGKIWKEGSRWRFWAGSLKREVQPIQKVWRGGEYWVNYTQEQFEALKKLTMYCHFVFKIPINYPDTHLQIKDNLFNPNFSGIYSHGNVRDDKVDVSPAFHWNQYFTELNSDLKKFKHFLEVETKKPQPSLSTMSQRSSTMTVKDALEAMKNMTPQEIENFTQGDTRKTVLKNKS